MQRFLTAGIAALSLTVLGAETARSSTLFDSQALLRDLQTNGADDNASGAAALVAITGHFAKHRPADALIVVACDGEETGLRGAAAFAATPTVPAASIIVNVNLDMIGRDSDDKLFAVGTRLNPFLKPYVETAIALIQNFDRNLDAIARQRNAGVTGVR